MYKSTFRMYEERTKREKRNEKWNQKQPVSAEITNISTVSLVRSFVHKYDKISIFAFSTYRCIAIAIIISARRRRHPYLYLIIWRGIASFSLHRCWVAALDAAVDAMSTLFTANFMHKTHQIACCTFNTNLIPFYRLQNQQLNKQKRTQLANVL